MGSSPTIFACFYYHSCTAVVYENNYLLFDYFPDPADKTIRIPADKAVTVFSTHQHADHYHPRIFEESFIPSSANYVLSEDIKAGLSLTSAGKSIYWMKPHEQITLDSFVVKTLGSTDLGVSYLVEFPDFSLFHSGDLNWWHWKKFSLQEQEQERIDFQKEIALLANTSIDLAFVPVDPRLEEFSDLAADYFIEQVRPTYLVPIHLQTQLDVMHRYAQKCSGKETQVMDFSKAGECLPLAII